VSHPRAPSRPSYDVAALRRAEFPWADQQIFLNHASTGPIPERTRRALQAFTDRRADFRFADSELQGILADARARAARLINAEVGEIALTTNTSFGLNLAARILPFEPGDRVIVSADEFPANVFPWQRLGDRGVTLELLPVTPEGWPDEALMLERMRDPRVRALAVSHVQFHNGYCVDLARLGAAARASETWLVVDSIQALGRIPFDVRATPVDLLACGGQKWLLSPWGSGFCYVRRELIPDLVSPFAGWSAFEGTDNYATLCDYSGDWLRDARRFELTTLPFQDLLGMTHALDLLDELRIERIAAHLVQLEVPVLEWAHRRGIRVVSPEGARGSGMVCLSEAELPDPIPALREAGITASVREGALRLSPHCYNTLDELERVVAVLEHQRRR
jgi:cysteine desulfurase/selenocysteine lyase